MLYCANKEERSLECRMSYEHWEWLTTTPLRERLRVARREAVKDRKWAAKLL